MIDSKTTVENSVENSAIDKMIFLWYNRSNKIKKAV